MGCCGSFLLFLSKPIVNVYHIKPGRHITESHLILSLKFSSVIVTSEVIYACGMCIHTCICSCVMVRVHVCVVCVRLFPHLHVQLRELSNLVPAGDFGCFLVHRPSYKITL